MIETLSSEDETMQFEVEVPDDTEPDALEDAITRALNAAGGESQEIFANADELFAVEELESGGVVIEWPALPGFSVKFSHAEAAKIAYGKLEREYRVKNKIDGEQKLSPAVEEGLLRESLFGTAVRDWSGLRVKGSLWEFTKANYRKMWAKKRFRNWALSQISRLGTSESPALEQVRGNS